MSLFKQANPKNELEGIDKAVQILNDRYEKKQITLEQYQKQCLEFAKKREKYERILAKQNR